MSDQELERGSHEFSPRRTRLKVTVVGAGNVGATAAQEIVRRDYADVVLVVIKENLPQGKALDISQAGPVCGYNTRVVGTNGYEETADSSIAVITSGIPRKPGMSRDELLATKFPYGYSSSSLPNFVTLPDTKRIMGALPQRGDVVVFRWPGDRSQIWVKRVVGLPGDRIAMRDGRLWINGAPVGLTSDGLGSMEEEDGSHEAVARFIETLPGKGWFVILRLYSPLESFFNKSWKPSDVEEVAG